MQIKVFDLKQRKLNESQLLSYHQQDVLTLNFMKKSNHFVSGSTDKSIIIWYMNQNNQWKCQQKLDGHSDAIGSLLLNNNENFIISGSQFIYQILEQIKWMVVLLKHQKSYQLCLFIKFK
ncbi:unnamed protein product [Paramecium primaurelia]|uniref:Uncharacterized protein n=1 Tax=Paramecium primaurelia TaxID=5886 RepID=A0A8S1QV86_PARPR|nr:unnamed protein product [Paramecium primaurelia]